MKLLGIGQFAAVLGCYLWLGVIRVPLQIEANFSDLLLHATGYTFAVFSAYVAFPNYTLFYRMLILLWTFSGGVELVQHFLPWRSLSGVDMLANGSGILMGYLLLSMVRPLIDFLLNRFGLKAS
ncbi:VanZ family protein [Halioxenophilus sp. WMMB6]|uniref:VanZ family protein n=1 Tax=Halioxenophilus sp. WMMB6 TaxID=3073815 RepID=UPI00295F356A|nr:VanZ family protein [Halioxenophilus sp. WMMB6]